MPRASRKPDPLRVAVHEAGHAVMGWRLGRPFAWVTTMADAGTNGHCFSEAPLWLARGIEKGTLLDAAQRRWAETTIIATLAGEETERAWAVTHGLPGPEQYSGHADRKIAVDVSTLVMSMSPWEAEAHIEWLRRRCITEMDEAYWICVNSLADELEPGARLSYRQAVKVIRRGFADAMARRSSA